MSAHTYDPRSIANFMLDIGDESDRAITNLALQKLLYFAHAIYLIGVGRPLVSGYFEAWQYGPVHPTVYQSFKAAADTPISFRATSQDILTGQVSKIFPPADTSVREHLRKIMALYGGLTPGRLVEISHAEGAPWHFVVDKSRTSVALGLRILDAVILERFKYHKVMVSALPIQGEPGEDSPFFV